MIAKLQVEYLSAAVATNGVYSLTAAAAPAGGEAPALFFQIIDADIDRKKLLRSSKSSTLMRAMSLPLSVQWLSVATVVDASASAPSGYQLILSGEPVLVDLLSMSSWDELSQLQQWSLVGAAQSGCLAVSDGKPAVISSDWQSPATPVLCLLQQLNDAGWQRTLVPIKHTATSAKLFRVDSPLERKAYLRCLVGVETLRQRGLLELPVQGLVS